MDFLTNKYISPDELVHIAYNTSPKDIISFCQVNTITKRICRSANFWSTYINDDQNKYNKLMIQLAVEGDLALFIKFWGNGALRPKNIVSDPVILDNLFKACALNGNTYMAAYIYTLKTLVMTTDDSSDKDFIDTQNTLYNEIKKLYSRWQIDPKTVSRSHYLVNYEFRVSLTYLIKKKSNRGSSSPFGNDSRESEIAHQLPFLVQKY